MIDFAKYGLSDDDIKFFLEIKDWCINGQSEVSLEYGSYGFCLEPGGQTVQVVDATGMVGEYPCFDDLFLHHKIDGKPLIELIRDLEFGD